MSIRLRTVNGRRIAICAARSVPKEGDVYLDDGAHHALANKFTEDFVSEGFISRAGGPIEDAELREREESNNLNRDWWDKTYGSGS